MGTPDYSTPKKNACREPRHDCRFFGESKNSYECTALIQCFCALEDKPCEFHKPRGDAEKAAYAAAHGAIIKTTSASKILPRATVEQAVHEHEEMGLSYEVIAKKYNISRKKLDQSRRYYGFEMERPKRRTEISDKELVEIVLARKAGQSWRVIEKSTHYSADVIKARLRERGYEKI